MFERMDIEEYIYEGVVEPFYKKSTGADAIHTGHIKKKRGEAASSHTYYAMSERAGRRRKVNVEHPKGE